MLSSFSEYQGFTVEDISGWSYNVKHYNHIL